MQRKSYRIRTVDWAAEAGRLGALRKAVLVDELGGPADLVGDAVDAAPATIHVLATDDEDRLVGSGRLHRDGDAAWVARMAVHPEWRTQGVGHTILGLLLATASRWGVAEVRLRAPVTARRFYEKHGFGAVGAEFDEAGVPHLELRQKL